MPSAVHIIKPTPAALDDLTNVSVPAPADGDLLTYVAANGAWEAKVPPSGAVAEDDISFLDHFADASLYWTWRVLNTSAQKTVIESASALAVHVDNGTSCDWSGSTFSAPIVAMAVNPPCEFIVKRDSGSGGGIFVSKSLAAGGGTAYLFDLGPTGYGITQSGITGWGPVGAYTEPAWMKIRIDANGTQNVITFWYSSDGVTWTQFSSGGFSVLSDFYLYGLYVGFQARSAGSPAVDAVYDYAKITRPLGPR